MADGMELKLGWKHGTKDLLEVAKELGVEIDLSQGAEEHLISSERLDEINKELVQIHQNVLTEHFGFKVNNTINNVWSSTIEAETPKGKREMHALSLEVSYDPYEMGDELEDAVLSVALTGRYRPTLLDWEEPHGAPYVLELDDKLMQSIDLIKKKIAEKFPIFESAYPIVKFEHY